MTNDERFRRLAQAYLADYDYVDALHALIDVEGCTPADIPDDILVQAARRHLETLGDPSRGGPCEAFHEVLFEV